MKITPAPMAYRAGRAVSARLDLHGWVLARAGDPLNCDVFIGAFVAKLLNTNCTGLAQIVAQF